MFKNKNAIGDALRELRESRQLTGKELADMLGSTQGHVSKIENGRLKPTTEYISKVCSALRVPASARNNLLAMASAFLISFNRWAAGQESFEGLQSGVLKTQKKAKLIEMYGVNILPGFLQAEKYATKIFESFNRSNTEQETAEALRKAIKFRLKQRELLEKGKKSYSIILCEAVLADRPFGKEVHLEQLKLLLSMTKRDNVDLRVLPFDAERPAFVMNTFIMFDRTFIEVETQTMATNLWEKEDIGVYSRLFDELKRVSKAGREVEEIVQRHIKLLAGK